MIECQHTVLQLLIAFYIDYIELLLSCLVTIDSSAMASMLATAEIIGDTLCVSVRLRSSRKHVP